MIYKMKVSTVFLLIATSVVLLSASASAKNIFCYFTSWSVYREGNGTFGVNNVDPLLCTHILYGFVGLTNEGTIQILDDWEAINNDGYQAFANLVKLKEQNSDLKILISMGGWNEGSQNYSDVAADPAKRKTLAEDVLSFLDKHKFDGFDLDWNYPGVTEGADRRNDRDNFVELLKELRTALNPKGYLLTAAVSAGISNIDIAYDIPLVSQQLDMINVMSFDYHGNFESFVGHVAPLSPSSKDTGENATLNVKSSIQYWIENGADPAKLNLGLVTYGRSFTLADENNTELYAPTLDSGTAGPYTEDGVIGYNEICELYNNWTYTWDDEQEVPHKVSGDQWVGYDDERSLTLKVQYAIENNLGGVMVWSLDTDDFRGLCGSETYPLLRTIKRTLN